MSFSHTVVPAGQNPAQTAGRGLPPGAVFALGLAAVVILAAALRLPYVDWGLPYIEYGDEAHLYWHGQSRRGLYDPDYAGFYPPVFVWMNVTAQQALENAGRPGLAPTVHTLRLLAALANTACTVLIGLAAYHAAGSLAGWAAALGWAVSAHSVEHALYAIPEPFVYPLVALCLLLAGMALTRPERWRLALWSLAAAALAFLFEYRLFVLALPGGAALLLRLGGRLTARRWALLALAALNAAALGLAGMLHILPEAYQRWLVRALLWDMWDFDSLYGHIHEALRGIGQPELVAAVLLVGLAALLFARRRGLPHPDLKLLALYAVMFLLLCWVMSAVRWPGDLVRTKNTLIAAIAGGVLVGAAIAQAARLLRRPLMKAALVIPAAALLFVPQVQATSAMLNGAFTGVSWHVVIRQWADVNLTPGTVIVYPVHGSTFNPFWGGIPHRYWFDWWPTDNLMQYSLDEWRARGMSYAAIPIPQHRALLESEAGRQYLDSMLRLRDFVHPPARRGAEAIFYRLERMQTETGFRFGDAIILAGYDTEPHGQAVRPGEALALRFYWQAAAPPADNYSLFIHLVPPETYTILSQADGAPGVPERPTLTWDNPSETLISPAFALPIPDDLPPGSYRVMVGLYNFETGQRLPVTDPAGEVEAAPGDALELLRLRVQP